MATLWNLMLVVLLLVLSAPQRCSGVDHDSLELRDLKLLSALQVVNNALKCTSENVKEGVRLHEKNNEALKDLQSLPELVLMVKEQMHVQNENIDSMKKQLSSLQVVDGLSQEIARLKYELDNKNEMVKALTEENEDIKQKLQNKDERVRHLEESVAECQLLVSNHTNTEQLLSNKVKTVTEEIEGIKQQLQNKDEMVRHLEELVSNHTNTEQLLSNKVQVLEERIVECQEKKEWLDEQLAQSKDTVAAQKKAADSPLKCFSHGQEITRLVEQYSNTKDWGSLRRGMEAVLDRSSEPYRYLQSVDYSESNPLYYVGRYGSTQLVSLLLDAGLPVDTSDAGGYTMIQGAAYGGHLQLVKLLLDHGASVHVSSGGARTLLMHAAWGGHLDVVKHLVSSGADTTATDNERRTALDIARQYSTAEVVQYLQQLPH